MFHVTNFTESSESYWTLDKLTKSSMLLWEKLVELGVKPEDITPEKLSDISVDLARGVYEEHFRRPLRPLDQLQEQEQAVFMLNAVCSNWFGLWAHNAFPRVQMSHSFAAMLMATKISPTELPFVEAPWDAFLIEVPDGLLPVKLQGGSVSYITRIHVVSKLLPTVLTQRWWGLWESGKAIEVVRAGPIEDAVVPSTKKDLENRPLKRLDAQFPERLEARDLPVSDEDFDEFWEGYDRGQEDRVSVLVGRLVTGVCTLMTEKANYTERAVKFEQTVAKHARRIGKAPESRVYTVGRPVKLDFRLAIKNYIDGTRPARGPLSVQRLVAGHHKWQPHGPGNTLRKWIFIEPYWQGNVDAPIVTRPHTLVGEE